MVYEFIFPDVGEGITEGKIVKWLVKEGDRVKIDQPLGEIETDKAVVEMPSPKAGIILKLHVAPGGMIKVGEVMVTIGGEGEKVAAKPAAKPAAKGEAKKEKNAAEKAGGVVGFLEEAEDAPKKPKTAEGIAVLPSLRKLAEERGVDLATVQGTGPGGRITKDDILRAAGAPPPTLAPQPIQKAGEEEIKFKKVRKYDKYGYVDHVPLAGIRKIIAEHMKQAVQQTAPVSHFDEADITHLVEIREKEKKKAAEKGVKLTYLPFIVKAVIAALRGHPLLNASLEGEEIIIKKYYNIGIAVDTGDGLIVPVVKGADQKHVLDIAKEIQDFAEKAKSRKIDLADLRGGSFTITNVGVIGGIHFTPIINYPECAILGIGRLEEKVIVQDGRMRIRKILPLSLTFDHRIVDGAEAARFMNDVKKFLEDPDLLVIGE